MNTNWIYTETEERELKVFDFVRRLVDYYRGGR